MKGKFKDMANKFIKTFNEGIEVLNDVTNHEKKYENYKCNFNQETIDFIDGLNIESKGFLGLYIDCVLSYLNTYSVYGLAQAYILAIRKTTFDDIFNEFGISHEEHKEIVRCVFLYISNGFNMINSTRYANAISNPFVVFDYFNNRDQYEFIYVISKSPNEHEFKTGEKFSYLKFYIDFSNNSICRISKNGRYLERFVSTPCNNFTEVDGTHLGFNSSNPNIIAKKMKDIEKFTELECKESDMF